LNLFSYIKLSSPKLNNIMVIGAMHIHLSILCFALDEWLLNRHLFEYFCMVFALDWLRKHIFDLI